VEATISSMPTPFAGVEVAGMFEMFMRVIVLVMVNLMSWKNQH
jgi:hypothetical protein